MTLKDILIRGGTVVDPSQDRHGPADILVKNGVIVRVERDIPAKDAAGVQIVEAAGKIVMPGLIDMHTHLREPGGEDAETIESGCEAAAAGGYTAVCPMPNTDPPTDDAGRVRFILERAENARARVYPIGAITKGRAGETLVEMAEMARDGAVAFSDDGVSVATAAVMQNALRYAWMVGKPIIAHEEEPTLVRGAHMNEGALSVELGLGGMPRTSEEIMVMRDIALAEYTGTRLHVTHISTRGTIDLIRAAKKRGVAVTCDVTPHHLTLTEDLVATFDTCYKMNPPLRTLDDVEALCEGLRDGSIDAVATDHAPHSMEAKEREFINAPFGVTGLETALGVIHRELVAPGILTWDLVAARMSLAPATILGIPGGTLAEGAPADITIYDPECTWTVDPATMKSRSTNTCFAGWKLPGRTAATVVGGTIWRTGDDV